MALELCGFDVGKAAHAIRRLFHEVVVLRGRVHVGGESLFVLFQAILGLAPRSLLRARAVVSYNPAVFSVRMDQDWFEFEKHLFASRLRVGALAPESQDLERLLHTFFASRYAAPCYVKSQNATKCSKVLEEVLSDRFQPHPVRLELHKDVIDMGQFQEIAPPAADAAVPVGAARSPQAPAALVLRVALEGKPDGAFVRDLRPGDHVFAQITDTRDIARYLSRVFGAQAAGAAILKVPIESVETSSDSEFRLRVRFSTGAYGELVLPGNVRLRAVAAAVR